MERVLYHFSRADSSRFADTVGEFTSNSLALSAILKPNSQSAAHHEAMDAHWGRRGRGPQDLLPAQSFLPQLPQNFASGLALRPQDSQKRPGADGVVADGAGAAGVAAGAGADGTGAAVCADAVNPSASRHIRTILVLMSISCAS